MGEAVDAGAVVLRVFYERGDDDGRAAARRAGADAVAVTPRILAKLSTTGSPQSPIAVIAIPDERLPEDGDVLVVWGVGDPGNVGTLVRTAAAFGMRFAAGPGSADVWSPKVLRAAAGGHFHTVVAEIGALDELGDRTLVATVPHGGAPPASLPGGPLAILVGDEAAGLPDEVVERARFRATVPMPGGAESLNAAVAGAIVMYEAARRPGAGPVTAKH